MQGVKLLFLVGGFAESAMLQHAVQAALGARGLRVVVPHDVALTILKGAVLFGQAPGVVRVRRSPLTYGVGVLNRFVAGVHPPDKLLIRPAVTRAPPPAFPRNPRGRLGFPGPTQGEG